MKLITKGFRFIICAMVAQGGGGVNAEAPSIGEEDEADIMAIIHENVLGGDDSNATSEGEGGGGSRESAEESEEVSEEGAIESGDGDNGGLNAVSSNNDFVSNDSNNGSSSDDSVRSMADSRGGSEGVSTEEAEETAEAEVGEQPTEIFEVTAYTAGTESTGKSPGDAGYGITASGESVQAGRTLACPPSLPFGTKVAIEGVGERVCTDRGSAITEGRLDVYMTDLEDAISFGRQALEVRVLTQ